MALIGLGSNIDPALHLKAAARAIRGQYPDAVFSRVYRSRPVGMSGENFLNACCRVQTVLDATAFENWLKSLEQAEGREANHDPWEPRTLDLDLLMLDGRMLDETLLRYAHVFVPASELMDLPIAVSESGDIRHYSSLSL